MSDRVRHDGAAVETVDGRLVRRGGIDRMAVALPEDAFIADGSPVRLVLDETEYKTVPRKSLDGSRVEIRGAYNTADAAQDPGSARNYLVRWIEANGLDPGRTVHLDIVTEGFRYGLRAPGEEAIYPAGTANTSLQDIAENL